MKLVTSSCESVFAALKLARERTTKSRADGHCGSRRKALPTAPAAARLPAKVVTIAA
jgi:hypothetical protein